MGIFSPNNLLNFGQPNSGDGVEGEGYARGTARVSSLLDSAPPARRRMTVDKLYACPPTVPIAAIETISAEQQPEKPLSPVPPKLLGIYGTATFGLRTSTKYAISLAKGPCASQ